MYTSPPYLVSELGFLEFLQAFGGAKVLQTLSQADGLVLGLVLAVEDIPQKVHVGELLRGWAGRGCVTLHPDARLFPFHRLRLLQGTVWLWPERYNVYRLWREFSTSTSMCAHTHARTHAHARTLHAHTRTHTYINVNGCTCTVQLNRRIK